MNIDRIHRKSFFLHAICLWMAWVCEPVFGQTDSEIYVDDFQYFEVESRLLLFQDQLDELSHLSDCSSEELVSVEKRLSMIDIKWNAYCQSLQVEIANNDSLLQLVADYQLAKQNVMDSVSSRKHYLESISDFSAAETFIQSQDSVYEQLYDSAMEYSLVKQMASLLEQVKGKEQMLFADIQAHYEKAKSAADYLDELQARMSKIEEQYIDLKNASAKIQALEYKPWFQRIKDYLFSLAAVSMILLFLNVLQSKIKMLKQARENAKKFKQMMNKDEDDYPSI